MQPEAKLNGLAKTPLSSTKREDNDPLRINL